MKELLKKLCGLNGTSGDETAVADFITANIDPDNAVIRRDVLGNVLVFKKGKKIPGKTVMFSAHMDEIGFIVTGITKDGFLQFAPVGGMNASCVFGRKVVFNNGIYGVIGGKPVHLLSSDEKDKQPKISDLLIDIGASCEDEAKKHISLGDYCYFVSEYSVCNEGGRDIIKAKAIDDRFGCAVMLDLLKHEPEYDCVFAFTVQEEIGCRGAAAAAFTLEPDICIVLEATTACDTFGVSDSDKVCELSGGAVISYMDKSTVYDRELYQIAFDVAKENNIKVQTKTMIAGGNDASVIHKSVGGIRTLAVSAPCRYIHTPSCVVDGDVLLSIRTLAEKLMCKFAEL